MIPAAVPVPAVVPVAAIVLVAVAAAAAVPVATTQAARRNDEKRNKLRSIYFFLFFLNVLISIMSIFNITLSYCKYE